MKSDAEQWLERVRFEYQGLSQDAYRQALEREFDWYHAIKDEGEGDPTKLYAMMLENECIPRVAREYLLRRLLDGKPRAPRHRKAKVTPFEIVHMVLYCKSVQGLGFSNKNGPEGNESFTAVAKLYRLTPDYVRKLFYSVPKHERDKREQAFSNPHWVAESARLQAPIRRQ